MLRNAFEAPKQNATDTISTLCSRLQSATLLEDRRGAILGLRSFAKHYPASVASGALRDLISTLKNDIDDVDTGKVVLETLLFLFEPDVDSPEASPEIALWLADEFSQRQDNIVTLLDRLDASDFYTRLHVVRLLTAVIAARPERTQECVLSAPLGTTRLVAILDDPRDEIRTAGLLLLNDLTHNSSELQKLVAFENAFERIFNIIQAEGALLHGGMVVQDCLALLANLVEYNAPNQSLFRETDHVKRFARMLVERIQTVNEPAADELGPDPAADKNLWGFLAVLRLFLIRESIGTQPNQIAFEKHGVLQLALNLGFELTLEPRIRAEALLTCADIIRGNSKIQERFAHNQVPADPALKPEGRANGQANGQAKTYIIDALLDMTLSVPVLALFDVRYAACECIQAYFYNHTPIRLHFLRRAAEGHSSGEDETSNILSILIRGPASFQSNDPYRLWFAARLAFLLLDDNLEAKKMAMAISEGNASEGEEVVTCIQAVAANLVVALRDMSDDRVCIGYLMLLCGWLFEDADAVDDLLGEASTVHSLITAALQNSKARELVQGLCVLLLGIVYEFSTKDSPMSRRSLQPVLVSNLGRDQYALKMARLREHPTLREFEVIPQELASAEPGLLPNVFLDQTFVNFVKDNFSRISRAIDRDPGTEAARLHEGVDRDLIDSLRDQIRGKSEALQKSESERLTAESALAQERASHRKNQDAFKAELSRIKNINDALHKGHEVEASKTESDHRTAVETLKGEQTRTIELLRNEYGQTQRDAERQHEATRDRLQNEIASLQNHVQDLVAGTRKSGAAVDSLREISTNALKTTRERESELEKLKKDMEEVERSSKANVVRDIEVEATIEAKEVEVKKYKEDVQKKTEQVKRLDSSIKKMEAVIKKNEASMKELDESAKAMDANIKKKDKAIEEKDKARKATQTELDDLMIVLGDLEDKRAKDKAKLKELGGETSDVESEAEDEGDNDDDVD